ncbi:hypothetical protein [Amphritea sp. HPY]|uniref:hypothetical protein n=1 Tax=Amphritea sp. HPY TaxID=3421652 RepID=UPI003D7C7B8D
MHPGDQQLPGISRIQQQARQLKLQSALTESQSLNQADHEHGFSDYQAYLDAVRKKAIQMMLCQNNQRLAQRSFS